MPKGGTRLGAGRPKGSGFYKEPTVPVRIPKSAVGETQAFLALRQEKLEILKAHQTPLTQLIPMVSASVAAGFPSPADDYIENWLDLNDLLIRDKETTFFVRVKGDSMKEANIYQGDVLIVDKGRQATNGDVVIAVLEGELTVKRLSCKEGRVALVSENPNYPTIYIKESQELYIWGIVTHSIHQHKR